MDWIHSNRIPPISGASFQIWTTSGSTRTCRRRPERDPCALWFTDCTHPLQQAWCDPDVIKAWRIKP
jgi:hypothetical protein